MTKQDNKAGFLTISKGVIIKMEKKSRGRRVIGILAHVDSGKTTLAEALLYTSGALREKGRVDHGDSYLDTGRLERQRGITIFSKIARFGMEDSEVILLDTPGHIDFAPEMERSLGVLDYCILVINGADGVTGRVKKLWQLLSFHEIPVLIFVNKMDQEGANRMHLFSELREQLSDHIVDFQEEEILSEDTAMLSLELMEEFLESGTLEADSIRSAITNRDLFPVWFGSALKGTSIDDFFRGIGEWTMDPVYPEEFSARVFKISRDEQGRRLTEMKITGGSLKNRAVLLDEKINELRLYSGGTFQSVQEVFAGEICSAAGLKSTWAGQGLGGESDQTASIQPVLSYRVIRESGGDDAKLLKLLEEIEEELPELNVTFMEETGEIIVHIMGEVLLDVLSELIFERSDIKIGVDEGSIIYRETVTQPVVGIGHFEPLKHYAEVHLLLEPNLGGQGDVEVASRVSTNELPLHWQNLILSHVLEKDQPGVLTGAYLSNIRITLVAGRGHEKHTTGGDFREATYRAIRQGLMEARAKGQAVLLEPMYEFEIMTDPVSSGRILNDLSRLEASSMTTIQDQGVLIKGRGPAATLRGYEREVRAITRGEGQMRTEFSGYDHCHNQEVILEKSGYDPEKDFKHPAGSIFTAQGAGYHVGWQEVHSAAHIPPLSLESGKVREASVKGSGGTGRSIDPEEVERIIASSGFANANAKKQWRGQKKKEQVPAVRLRSRPAPGSPVYLLIDGYNVIHAWPELKSLSEVNFDAAREKLQEILEGHQSYTGEIVYLVFDAYQVARNVGSSQNGSDFHVIFTREHETADQYIERKAMELASHSEVKVVTSDSAEQMSALASGALVYSARRFFEIIKETKEKALAEYEARKDREEPVRVRERLAKPKDE